DPGADRAAQGEGVRTAGAQVRGGGAVKGAVALLLVLGGVARADPISDTVGEAIALCSKELAQPRPSFAGYETATGELGAARDAPTHDRNELADTCARLPDDDKAANDAWAKYCHTSDCDDGEKEYEGAAGDKASTDVSEVQRHAADFEKQLAVIAP